MQAIEGYHLVRRIGAGGMGTVHEAVDADGNRVAVKVLHDAIAADPAARQRLRREVELLHRVRGEGVARVLDAEAEGATAFVVTELIDGPTLEEDVQDNGPLAEDELAGLAHGLAEGLHAIHAAGIAHRDLKPGNVMLSPRGPVIIDFGIAQVADDVRLTQTGMVTGTPGYLDPDVIAGGDPGPAGDWWAWAAVLTFAATGRPPFGRGTMQTVLARVSTGVVDTAGLPQRLATVLAAALEPEPARRLPPGDLLGALDGDWQRPALQELLADPPAPVPRTDVLPSAVAPPTGATRVMPPVPPAGRHSPMPPTETWPPVPAPQRAEQWQPAQPGLAPRVEPGPPHQAGTWPPSQRAESWPPNEYRPPGAGPVQRQGWAVPEEVPAWARPPRRRTATVASLGAGVTALAVVAPGYWVVGAVVLVVVLAAVGRGARRLRASRMRRGMRRSDAAAAWLGSPLHLLWAVGAVLPGLLLATVLAVGGWWVTHAVADPAPELRPWLLWGAAALGLGVLWTAPPSAAAREGARVALGGVPQPVRVGLTVLVLLTAVVVAGLIAGGSPPEPVWSPLPDPPAS